MRKSQNGWKSFFCPHLPESGATKWCICVLSSPLGARVIGNFVLCLLSWTNNSKLLPFKLSKINTYHPVISLGFSKTPLDHQNDHLDSHLDHHYHWSISLSLSGCFLSKLENHLDHLVRRINSENGRIIPTNSPSYVSPPHFQSTFHLFLNPRKGGPHNWARIGPVEVCVFVEKVKSCLTKVGFRKLPLPNLPNYFSFSLSPSHHYINMFM